MRVLVCGGRNYRDQERVFQELDARQPIELIIEGGANGADRQARYWALSRGIPCMTIHAAWQQLGKSAGHIRNGWMLKYGAPDLCLSFPGGAGTANMRKQAADAGVTTVAAE